MEGNFCPACGKASGSASQPPPGGSSAPQQEYSAPAQGAAQGGLSESAANGLCYLFGLITGVIFLVLAPYNTNRNVRFHAFQSIFFNVAVIVAWIVVLILGVVLNVVPVLGAIVGALLAFALWIAAMIVWVYLLIKAFTGAKVVLPVIGPLAEKQAQG
jgi:uncharacterized membrane protein